MGLNTQVRAEHISVSKRQSSFLGKTSLISGLCFALIFAMSFIMYKYWLYDASSSVDKTNLCYIIGSVSLLVAIFFSFGLSFRGTRASVGAYIFQLAIFTISYAFTFATFFSLVGDSIMFQALGYTSLAMLITGLIGYNMKDKTANVVLRISMYSFLAYFAVSMIGSIISWFTFYSSTGIEWYWILVNILVGVAIIGSNVYTFYTVKKMDEFTQLNEMESGEYKKLLLSVSTSLLLSIINTFIMILRLLLIFGRD